jgi:hypothetical protein
VQKAGPAHTLVIFLLSLRVCCRGFDMSKKRNEKQNRERLEGWTVETTQKVSSWAVTVFLS